MLEGFRGPFLVVCTVVLVMICLIGAVFSSISYFTSFLNALR